MDSSSYRSQSSPTSDPLAPLHDLEPTVGAFFLGAIACVGTLEILRSAISVHAGYYYSVKHWGNTIALLHLVWSMKLMIMLTNIVEVTVHVFFIKKVWQATYGQAKILCTLITLFALGDFAMGTVTYVLSYVLEANYSSILLGTPSRYATAALACAIGADWLITGALVKFFRANKTEFPRTSHILKKSIFYAVNLGLLTSFADVVVLILANYPHWKTLNFYQLTVFSIVGNLYANTFLACLNARNMVSEELSHNRSSRYHHHPHPPVPPSFAISFPARSETRSGHVRYFPNQPTPSVVAEVK